MLILFKERRVGRITTFAFAVPAMTTIIETGVIPRSVTLSGIGFVSRNIFEFS